jgi:hypothetical protein
MRQLLKNTTLLVTLVGTSSAFASQQSPMGICADSVAKYYPGKQHPNHYGNAATDSFRCAMSGSTQLTAEQIKIRKSLIPDSHDFRFYARVGLNAAAQQLRFPGAKVSQASNQFDAAFGYRWNKTSVELEWLNLGSINYTSLQVKVGPAHTLATVSGKVKGHALFLGANYEFYKFYNYSPYVNIAIGVTNNNTSFNFNSNQVLSSERYTLSGGLSLGMKFNIYSRFYADVTVRGLFLGNVKYDAKDVVADAKVKVTRIWLGASLRLIWLF